MNFKKGDIISNDYTDFDGMQWVKLMSDIKPNMDRSDDGNTRYSYPYIANILHVKGKYNGQFVDDYYIHKDSILIKGSEEFFNREIKSFEFV